MGLVPFVVEKFMLFSFIAVLVPCWDVGGACFYDMFYVVRRGLAVFAWFAYFFYRF